MPADLNQSFRPDPAELSGEAVIFGSTLAMRELREKIDSVLSSDLPILIQGESGTGKEVIARFLHMRSNRGEAPFVKLNCAAIPANLLERELFGSEKGSFTGSSEDRPGLVEIAEGGTLFLNEIGEMSLELQDKLLCLLGEGTYTRIGSHEKRTGRIRVVCATDVHLREAVQSGAFREDLFSRIDVVSLRLPPLRDRKDDIPQLCEHFLQKLSRQFRRAMPLLTPATLDLLKQWDWPGNLRELENWIARAVILGGDEALVVELKRQVKPSNGLVRRQTDLNSLKNAASPASSLVTGALILKALQANRWSRRKTADELKMSYRALLFKLRSVGMPQKRRSHRGPPRAH
ncbi:MAG: sigma-54 dependent transcriptional regulator [Terracidiphilus sp.]|jgi:two-component system response regulator AtoC